MKSRWLGIGQVLFFACLWTETKSRSINSQKKTRPISSHLNRTNLVNKEFIIWLLVKFCLQDIAGSPEDGSILPARGACHIIKRVVALCYSLVYVHVLVTGISLCDMVNFAGLLML